MPYVVRKNGSKTKPWSIVHARTGQTVGRSRTKQNAHKSASIRNASDSNH